jgi:hypothetical protein
MIVYIQSLSTYLPILHFRCLTEVLLIGSSHCCRCSSSLVIVAAYYCCLSFIAHRCCFSLSSIIIARRCRSSSLLLVITYRAHITLRLPSLLVAYCNAVGTSRCLLRFTLYSANIANPTPSKNIHPITSLLSSNTCHPFDEGVPTHHCYIYISCFPFRKGAQWNGAVGK